MYEKNMDKNDRLFQHKLYSTRYWKLDIQL